MSSLAHCIERSRIHPIEAKRLKAAAQAYRSEGFKAQESNESAVRDQIKTLQADRADIVKQIEKQISKIVPTKTEIITKGKLETVVSSLVNLPKRADAIAAIEQLFGARKELNSIAEKKNPTTKEKHQVAIADAYMVDMERAIIEKDKEGVKRLLRQTRQAERDPDFKEGKVPTEKEKLIADRKAYAEYEREKDISVKPVEKITEPETKGPKGIGVFFKVPGAPRQKFEMIRNLPREEADLSTERYYEVKDIKTGELQTVEESDLKPIDEAAEEYLTQPKFAKAVVPSKAKSTVAQIKIHAQKILSKTKANNLIDTGKVVIVENETGLPGQVEAADVKKSDEGAILGMSLKGTVYLVAGNLNTKDVYPVLLHESLHAEIDINGWKGLFGNRYDLIMSQYERLIEKGDPDLLEAQEMAERAGTLKEYLFEETLAYYVQNEANYNTSLFKKILNAVKAWAVKTGFLREVNAGDLVALAQATLRRRMKVTPKDKGRITESDVRYAREYTKEQQKAIKEGGFGVREKQTLRERINVAKVRLGAKLRQGIIDQYDSFTRILKDDTAWMMAHLTKSDAGVLMSIINAGTPVLEKSGAIDLIENSKSLKEILAPLGAERDDFFKWIAGHRAERLKAEDRENLLSKESIQALKTLNQGDMIDGSSRETIYQEVLKEFEKMGAAITQLSVDLGLIGAKEKKTWEDEGWYVPFYRMLEDDKVRGPSNINALTGQKGYHKLKGSSIQIEDLLSNVLMNWNHLISAGLRNQAGTKALVSAEAIGLAYKIPKTIKSKDAVYIRKNGKEEWYEIEDSSDGKLVLSSLLSLNQEGMNTPAMRILRKFKRMLSYGVVASPGYKIRNLIRDTIHAAAVTTASPNMAKNVLVGWKYDTKRMEVGGGAFGQSGYIYGSDPDAVKQLVRSGIDQDTILNTPGKIKKLWQKYQDFGAKLENINRVAGFEEDLKKGKSLLEANFNARDQLDFSRTGSFAAIRFIVQTVPFLNPRLQGLDKLGRSAIDENQRKQFATVAGSYALASVLLYMMMADDDDYKEAEDWEKRTYHLFKVPGSEKMYRIPRPFEIGALAYMTEKMTEQFIDKNAKIKDLGNALTHTLTDTFSFNPIPQAFRPLVEVYADKNMFTGRNIESLGLQRLSKPERFQPWTSEMMKGTSKAMSKVTPESVTLSPIQLEHMVRAYTGWLGTTVLAGIDGAIKCVSGEVTPKTKWYEYEPIKTLVRDPQSRNTKYTTTFYDNLKELTQLYGDVRKYRGTIKGKEIKKNATEKLRWRRRYLRSSHLLSNLRKRRKAVYVDSFLSSTGKRKQIDQLNRRISAITKKIVENTNYF